jgi:hypothetical protein
MATVFIVPNSYANQPQEPNWEISINFLYGDTYFESGLTFGQTLTVEATAANTTNAAKTLTLLAGLYDQTGRLRAISRGEGAVSNNGKYQTISVNVALPAANTLGYRVKAFVWDGVSIKPYVDSVPLTSTAADYYADTLETANFVDAAKTISGRMNTTSDVDFVKFSPATTGEYLVAVQSAQALIGTLYDNARSAISQAAVPTAQGITYIKTTLTQNQTNYIEISGGVVGDYTAAVYKPTSGGTLALNTAKNGVVANAVDAYQYSFTAPAAGTYLFTAVGVGEVKGLLYGSSMLGSIPAGTKDGVADFRISRAFASGETYQLVVTPKSGGGRGAYAVYVEVPMALVSAQ